MTYQPQPIDTRQVNLPPDLIILLEALARNAHDVWAQARIREGWTHGVQRDDVHKKHPCLVPYDQLPPSEKEYDRLLAGEILKVILALGFRIEKR